MKFLSHLIVLLLAVCAHCPVEADSANPRIVNRVAATVNGRPITSSEVRARLAPYVRELTMLYPRQGPRFNAELVRAKKAVLEELIERELVLCEFENGGLMIPDSAINEEINRRILNQFNGNRDALLENLRRSGMSYGEFRDSVRRELTVSAMRSSRYDRGIPPTPDEIQAEYRATRSDYRDMTQDSISYDKIFIPMQNPDDPNATPEMQYALSEQLVKDIESGAITFEEAARRHSRDIHAEDGGRWPFVKRCDLAVEFANIVFSLPKGRVTGPLVDPRLGFTIVRVVEKRLAPAPSLNARGVRARVDEAVRRRNNERRYREWVERLRGRAIIRTYI